MTLSPITSTKNHKPYRILLPLDRDNSPNSDLFRLARALADAHQGEILILHVVTEEGAESSEPWRLPEDAVAGGLLAELPYRLISCKSETVADGIIETARQESCALILLKWQGSPRAIRNKLGHVLDPVIEDAPCDVALLKGECTEDALNAPRILLATSGGPHTIGAARLAFALARFGAGEVTLLTILPKTAHELDVAQAEQMLAQIISKVEEAKKARQEAQVKERMGLLSSIELGLELKFGKEGLGLFNEVQQIQEMSLLSANITVVAYFLL